LLIASRFLELSRCPVVESGISVPLGSRRGGPGRDRVRRGTQHRRQRMTTPMGKGENSWNWASLNSPLQPGPEWAEFAPEQRHDRPQLIGGPLMARGAHQSRWVFLRGIRADRISCYEKSDYRCATAPDWVHLHLHRSSPCSGQVSLAEAAVGKESRSGQQRTAQPLKDAGEVSTHWTGKTEVRSASKVVPP
jgi:hypothetical protein